ncbi:hypothetical protein KDD17_01675 [Sulfitobacter albidus]|uniref:Uncharacterized protein n=1 Tax=Sulfitobacter albidus TaxID=2829501 RepID=A0A975JED2_9RHOB|nr:hypothetical protein [Sulfitobacter albidus]QUJ76797.1 hypothetical protein KDD17_01675 [Sulfitobacter albidus]
MDLESWFDFFELSDDAERHAADLRNAGLGARLLRTDYPLQVTPCMVSRQTIARQAEIYATLLNALLRLPETMFDGDIAAFAKAVGFEGAAITDLLAAPDDALLPCRWDLCQKNGQWFAFEANFGGALGGLPSEDMHAVYDALPLPGGPVCDRWKSAGEAIAESFIRRFGPPDTWQMVVLDDADHFAQSPLTANAAAAMMARHLGQEVSAIAHTDLDHVLDGADKPHVAFELFTLRDIAARSDHSYDAYLSHCARGTLHRGISLLCDLYMSKACLALLHEAADGRMIGPAICEVVRAAIPKTQIVRTGTVAALSRLPKDQHVLKSALGYGGTAVFCGWEIAQDTWDDLLVQAADPAGLFGMCVLQRRVDGDRAPSLSMMPDGTWIESDAPQVLGVFQIEGQLCGGVVRQAVIGGGVANAARQASVGLIRRIAS